MFIEEKHYLALKNAQIVNLGSVLESEFHFENTLNRLGFKGLK